MAARSLNTHEHSLSVSNVPTFYREISAVSLGFFTSQEIEQLSVAEIDFAVDQKGKNLANTSNIEGGLYDLRLGPSSDDLRCATCSLDFHRCPGHFGHINLPTVMYNPAIIKELVKLLKASCWVCNRFKCSVADVERYAQKFALLDCGDISGYFELEEQEAILKARKARENELKKEKVLDEAEEIEFEQYKAEVQSQIQHKLANIRLAKQHNATLLELRRQLEKSFFHENTDLIKCHSCKAPRLRPRLVQNGSIYRAELKRDDASKLIGMGFDPELNMVVSDKEKGNLNKVVVSQKLLFPYVAKQLIQNLFENEQGLLKYFYGHVAKTHDPVRIRITHDAFFFEKLLVTPPLFRPLQKIQEKHLGAGVNTTYTQIVATKHEVQDHLKSEDATNNQLASLIDKLQKNINALFDRPQYSEDTAKGFVQILDKKRGLIRGHMMGKRVNFAGRTVLTPDVLLNTNQIGIPMFFAQKLSFPEPVTFRNFDEMAERVKNGPDKFPGANWLEDSKGFFYNLSKMTEEDRISHSKRLISRVGTTVVHRHIKDGDVVLVNRQPTLHKPSIMAHYVKVLKVEKTLRLHYANCSTFNADFDGDEMNVHVPQSIQARAEADQIAMADYQYLTLRHGGPLRGLIQDHILMGVFLTKRDTFINQEQFQQLIYSTCMEINFEHPIELPPPCLLKPQKLWSGKQAITAVINQVTYGKPKINLDSKAKVPEDLWGKGSGEADLIIRDNELLCGLLDKNQFGATAFGLIHAVYELLGARVAGQLLSSLSRLFTMFLAGHSFTCGMDDLTLTASMEANRKKQLLEANNKGISACQQFTGEKDFDTMMTRQAQLLSVPEADKQLDTLIKQQIQPVVSKLVDTCIPHGATKKWPHNNMAMMTITGAKGSTVNFSQVSTFNDYLTWKISCLLGQQELEGKRVPRMVSGRTLPSFEPYDPKARAGGFIADRFLTGLKPQEYFFHCMAGREGLIDTAVKTSRSGYLQRCIIKHLEGIQVHYDLTVRDADGSVIQFLYGEDGLEVSKTKFLDKFSFLARNTEVLNETNPHFLLTTGGVNMKAARRYLKGNPEMPILSELDPAHHVGAISEAYQKKIDQYIEKNPDGLLSTEKGAPLKPAAFEKLMHLRYMKALVHPGEPVGVVAGQCIGEPSTQMTLNSVDWLEKIIIKKGDDSFILPIGEFIDTMVDGNNATVLLENGTSYLDVHKMGYQIVSLDENGKISWKLIEAVTRHYPINKDGSNTLLKVITRSGRSVTATKAKSFLMRKDNRIVPVEGSDLKVGDHIPITSILDVSEEITSISTEKYLPKDKYLHYSEITKAKNIKHDYVMRRKIGWWKENRGKSFVVPYKRPDTCMDVLTKYAKDGSTKFSEGYVYPRHTSAHIATIPDTIVLDNLFGFFVGAYLAEGMVNKTQLIISNQDKDFQSRIYEFCQKWNLGYHIQEGEHPRDSNWKSYDIRIHSTLMCDMMKQMCGTGCAAKHIPSWAPIANRDFLRGLIDGYFCGDGSVDASRRWRLRASSASEDLIDGIAMILTRFGILSKKSVSQLKKNNVGSLNILPSHVLTISNGDVAKFYEEFKLTVKYKQANLEAIKGYGFSYEKGKFDVIPGININGESKILHRNVIKEMLTQNISELARTALNDALNQDVYFDEIVAIEEVAPTHEYVYDFTVKDTKNFGIFNGIQLRDTFHLAGRGDVNVTLGIPRLRELIMVASKAPSTPSMTLPLRESNEALGQKALTELSQFSFFDLVDSIQIIESTILEGRHRYRIYKTHLQLKTEAELKKFNVTKKNIRARLRQYLQFSEKTVIGVLRRQFNISLSAKLASHTKGAFAKSEEEDNEDEQPEKTKRGEDHPLDEDDSESSADEDEEGNDKWSNKRKEEEGLDDEEEQQEEEKEDDEDKEKGKPPSEEPEDEEVNHMLDMNDEMEVEKAVKGMIFYDATDSDSLVHRFGINFDQFFVEVVYKIPPLRSKRIMMLSVLEDAMRNCFYSPVKGVKKCFLGQDSEKKYQIITEGCNLRAVWEHRELFDVNRINTNHVYEVLQVYGVEAARSCIIKEIATVFSVYGIAVDFRHLSLIADYMTFHGDYKAMNRIGMQNQTSPWQRISFETSTGFLTAAALHGDVDKLKSPSASLVFGKRMTLGTGICDCIVPLSVPERTIETQPQDDNQIALDV